MPPWVAAVLLHIALSTDCLQVRICSAGSQAGFTNQAIGGAAAMAAWLLLTAPVKLPYTGEDGL